MMRIMKIMKDIGDIKMATLISIHIHHLLHAILTSSLTISYCPHTILLNYLIPITFPGRTFFYAHLHVCPTKVCSGTLLQPSLFFSCYSHPPLYKAGKPFVSSVASHLRFLPIII